MKRVFATADPVQAGWLESLLGAAGIACLVRNRYLGGAIGELPLNECWPELWVLDDADLRPAELIVREALAPPMGSQSAWRCPRCGEALEAQFELCWQCGSVRPAT